MTGSPDPTSPGRHTASGFHRGSRSLRDRFDTRALAGRIDGLLVKDTITEDDRFFIEDRDMFFLVTADAERPTCPYKGGEPAFVRVMQPHTVAFPNYFARNGMYLSTGNVLVNSHVGLLFIGFEQENRMRLEGAASIDTDDPSRGD